MKTSRLVKNIHFQKTNDGKQILRDMMKAYIPDKITQAKKQGFSSPDASWFKGESIEFVKRKLLRGNPRIYEYLDSDALRESIRKHLDGSENLRLLIWSLLNVETCLEWMEG